MSEETLRRLVYTIDDNAMKQGDRLKKLEGRVKELEEAFKMAVRDALYQPAPDAKQRPSAARREAMKKQNEKVGAWIVGKNYLVRTVTMYWVGRLTAIDAAEMVLSDASWVADTGRFNECLSSGVFGELEHLHGESVIVGRGALVDATLWKHDLPGASK